MTFVLRPYQTADITRISEALRDGGRVLYRLPTGGGKTVIFAHIAQKMAEAGKRVIILTHRRTLVRQTAQKLFEEGIDYGVIAAGYMETLGCHVQIAAVQSLASRIQSNRGRYQYASGVDLVVVDEAHHTVSGQFLQVLEFYGAGAGRLLGVTATPRRLDGRPLNPPYNRLVVGESEEALIRNGFLADYRLFLPPNMHDPLYNRRRNSEVTAAERHEAEEAEGRTGDAVGLYRNYLDGQPAIAFCYSIGDAERVATAFVEAGIAAAAVSSKDKEHQIKSSLEDYENGAVQVLCTCDLIAEGFDMPATKGVLLMRKTESLTVHLQQIGRAMRPKPDGGDAIIIDMVNNTDRHGLPDDNRTWGLGGKEKNSGGGAAIKRCSYCFAVAPSHAKVCKHCGKMYPIRSEEEKAAGMLYESDGINKFVEIDKIKYRAKDTPEGQNELEAFIGRIMRMSEGDRAAHNSKMRQLAGLYGAEFAKAVEDAKTIAEVKDIAMAKGYDIAWVRHVLWGKKLSEPKWGRDWIK